MKPQLTSSPEEGKREKKATAFGLDVKVKVAVWADVVWRASSLAVILLAGYRAENDPVLGFCHESSQSHRRGEFLAGSRLDLCPRHGRKVAADGANYVHDNGHNYECSWRPRQEVEAKMCAEFPHRPEMVKYDITIQPRWPRPFRTAASL